FTSETLHYQGQAIEHIQVQLQTLTSPECTIGAILLLVGIEWRMGVRMSAHALLKGLEMLLQLCEKNKYFLSPSVRRGIFWQDLNTAIVTNTNRVMSRATFPEFQWGREAFISEWSILPPGFEKLRAVLGDTTEVLQDIYVLQKYSEALGTRNLELASVHALDNLQACIEARLQESLREWAADDLKTVILLAAYLFTYSLFTSVWNGSAIQLHLSERLYQRLESPAFDGSWETFGPVLLWCTVIGGCLVPRGNARSQHGAILREKCCAIGYRMPLQDCWSDISAILEGFLWSSISFEECGLSFLKEVMLHDHVDIFQYDEEYYSV
ncbi:hypothetical protein P154DRAFT_437301, partial [Amniculicola lignicola CBS 123094]